MSGADLARDYGLLHGEGGVVAMSRDVVRVGGPEAAVFLQGQISQDIETLGLGGSAWSFALQPSGKVHSWFRVSVIADDHFLCDLDTGFGEGLAERLARFKLRTDCTIDVEAASMLSVRGASIPGAVEGAEIVVDPQWPGALGVDAIGAELTRPEGLAECSTESLEVLRIEAGVPAHPAELDDSIIPAETGVVERSVSFTKGCFTGQELVARIDSRGGNVPRRLRGVVASEPFPVGAQLRHDGDPVGHVTSASESPRDGWIGLAYVKRAVDPGAGVDVDGVVGEVRELPLGS